METIHFNRPLTTNPFWLWHHCFCLGPRLTRPFRPYLGSDCLATFSSQPHFFKNYYNGTPVACLTNTRKLLNTGPTHRWSAELGSQVPCRNGSWAGIQNRATSEEPVGVTRTGRHHNSKTNRTKDCISKIAEKRLRSHVWPSITVDRMGLAGWFKW